MRITGGDFRGRKIGAPEGRAVRPTSDKVRQAVFNMLLKYGLPADAAVLDAFCGTGALGLEALSRGASSCVFIDSSRESLAACRANIESLGAGGRSLVLQRDAVKPGARREVDGVPAGLVFLDPPYRQGLAVPALAALAAGGWMAPSALCVAECEKGAPCAVAGGLPPGFSLLDSRSYGDTQVLTARYDAPR